MLIQLRSGMNKPRFYVSVDFHSLPPLFTQPPWKRSEVSQSSKRSSVPPRWDVTAVFSLAVNDDRQSCVRVTSLQSHARLLSRKTHHERVFYFWHEEHRPSENIILGNQLTMIQGKRPTFPPHTPGIQVYFWLLVHMLLEYVFFRCCCFLYLVLFSYFIFLFYFR